jgi:hypothetical protein
VQLEVKLDAGLVEAIAQLTEGAPAPADQGADEDLEVPVRGTRQLLEAVPRQGHDDLSASVSPSADAPSSTGSIGVPSEFHSLRE